MKTGMLWFDNDSKTDLNAKITRASEYYQHKYGRRPDLCFVHPTMLQVVESEPASRKLAGVEVRINPMIQPNHLWIGVTAA